MVQLGFWAFSLCQSSSPGVSRTLAGSGAVEHARCLSIFMESEGELGR